jgi:hypothetical protein
VYQELSLVDLLLEAPVHLVQVFLLDSDLTITDCVDTDSGGVDSSGFLHGHQGPLLTC